MAAVRRAAIKETEMADGKIGHVAKLLHEAAEKVKHYKAQFNVERARDLLQVTELIRDHPGQAALAGAAGKELAGMNAKQAEEDTKERADFDKKMAEAHAEDVKALAKEAEASSPHSRAASR
jgi:hypothetical protein